MMDFKLYEITAYNMAYPEYLRQFKLFIEDEEFSLYEKEVKQFRKILLERFPITEEETREYDKNQALKLVEEI